MRAPAEPYNDSTIIGCKLNRAWANRDRVYLKSRYDAQGRKTEEVHSTLWSEAEETIRQVALGLATLGVAPGDRVSVFGPNSPRWIMVTSSIFMIRGTLVPIYPSVKSEDAWWCLHDSGAKVVFVHGPEQLGKVLAERSRMDQLEWIVVMNAEVDDPAEGVISFDELIARGNTGGLNDDVLEGQLREASEEDLVAIIYTSGTTGRPKGVMLSNKNIISQLAVVDEFGFTPEDVWFCHLPLCHSLGFSVDFLNATYQGGTMFLVDGLDTETIRRNLAACRPTVMTSVPRMWEKLYLQINETVRQRPGFVQRLFKWAMENGTTHFNLQYEGQRIPFGLRVKARLAGRIFSKVRRKAGLNRLKMCVTGGGPIHPDLLVFFGAMGIPLYQGFGLTETSPVTHVSTPGANKIGWIGKPIPDTECKLSEDGELLIRGPQVMSGYWRNSEATAEAFTEDGFLKTGDIAEIDDQGFVRITDRKKELIITSGGKNIAPQPIQNAFNTDPYIQQIHVVGDARKYIAALLVPNFEILKRWIRKQDISCSSPQEMVTLEPVKKLFDERVAKINKTLNKYETIKRFALLPQEFTEEAGELTPTLKMKRRVIDKKYHEIIDSLYPSES